MTHEENVKSARALWSVLAATALIGVAYYISVAWGSENWAMTNSLSPAEAQRIMESLKTNRASADQNPTLTPEQQKALNALKEPASKASQPSQNEAPEVNTALLDALKAH
ncbi:MAG: hypothetical protein ABSF56_03185 [Minisyncoccia bacterium]